MATGYTPVSAWPSQKGTLLVVIPLYIGAICAFIYLMFALVYQINLYYYFYNMDDSLEMQCLVTGKELIRKPCASVPLFEETCAECSCYSGEYLISYQDEDDSKVDASITTKAFVPQLKKKVSHTRDLFTSSISIDSSPLIQIGLTYPCYRAKKNPERILWEVIDVEPYVASVQFISFVASLLIFLLFGATAYCVSVFRSV